MKITHTLTFDSGKTVELTDDECAELQRHYSPPTISVSGNFVGQPLVQYPAVPPSSPPPDPPQTGQEPAAP